MQHSTLRSFMLLTSLAVASAACSSSTPDAGTSTSTPTTELDISASSAGETPTAGAATESSARATDTPATEVTAVDATDFYDRSMVHSIGIRFDQAEFDAMISEFQSSGDKTWIKADATIDGREYRQVGMRLKGNSSLFGLGGPLPGGLDGPGGPPPGGALIMECTAIAVDAVPPASDGSIPPPVGAGAPGDVVRFGPGGDVSADEPEGIPWLLRLDKYIADQAHDGLTDFVVRSNPSTTALNEIVALDLLSGSGLATQRGSMVRFSVNDRPAKLRLVIENPNDEWMAANFSADGKLYKADAQGDYTYRGDDPSAYKTAFEQDGGSPDDLRPVIDFLEFVNNSTDEEFAASLRDHLDVDMFARYLAMEDEILGNFDDIDGPGNNSYLYYDPATKKMTVVAWDHNLAFMTGPMGGPGGPGFGPPPGGLAVPGSVPFDPANLPEGCPPFDPANLPAFDPANPPSFDPANLPPGFSAMPGMNNPLTRRFRAHPPFQALIDAAAVSLKDDLIASGKAEGSLAFWSGLLADQAADLVDSDTLADETKRVADALQAQA